MGKLTNSYNLEKINPKLAKEWHPTKNGNLTPKDVTPSSGQKVWWICDNNHEWLAKIDKRLTAQGVPIVLVNLFAGITVYKQKIQNCPRNGILPRTKILHRRILPPVKIIKFGGSAKKAMNGRQL